MCLAKTYQAIQHVVPSLQSHPKSRGQVNQSDCSAWRKHSLALTTLLEISLKKRAIDSSCHSPFRSGNNPTNTRTIFPTNHLLLSLAKFSALQAERQYQTSGNIINVKMCLVTFFIHHRCAHAVDSHIAACGRCFKTRHPPLLDVPSLPLAQSTVKGLLAPCDPNFCLHVVFTLTQLFDHFRQDRVPDYSEPRYRHQQVHLLDMGLSFL